MKKFINLSILSVLMLVLSTSCEKQDIPSNKKIRNLKVEAIDACSAKMEFDLYLTADEAETYVQHYDSPSMVMFFSSTRDPIEYDTHSPDIGELANITKWIREVADRDEYYSFKEGKNHLCYVTYSLPSSTKGYTAMVRVKFIDEYQHETYWSKLEKFKMPPVGDPYARSCSVSDISSTGATAAVIWSPNGYYISDTGCILNTDKSSLERLEGLSILSTDARPYTDLTTFTDLTPGTTYYFKPWCNIYDVFNHEVVKIIYSNEIYSFKTLDE